MACAEAAVRSNFLKIAIETSLSLPVSYVAYLRAFLLDASVSNPELVAASDIMSPSFVYFA
jgi:hypothetical protein